MKAIYSNRPLTPQEQAHLLAFLQQAVAGRPTQAVGRLMLLAALGTVALLAVAQLAWRRRLRDVRRAMLKRT